MKLVIVESPTKAKTLSRFLGDDFVIKSSYGHIRDLPKSEMGVDIEHDFTPKYVVGGKSRKVASELKKDAKKADIIYFATDGDREGEAISWHLKAILKPVKSKRIIFHEITKKAILESLEKPQELDMDLVDAQQARRILDRLVGYELSPFLWKKVAKGLSAGRVQSVAVRLIVEREREIEAFKPQEYWSIIASFFEKDKEFEANLNKIDGKTLDKFAIENQKRADEIVNDLKGAEYNVSDIQKKQTKRNPLPPFTTSTLQQEANHRLGFSSKQTMMLAQQLYEGIEKTGEGLITYMRTDSVTLSDKFLNESREIISAFGPKYLPKEPHYYKTKSKLAQEAHEAIRPTSASRTPDSIKDHLDDKQWKLYDLIWRRAVASQMTNAVIDNTSIEINAKQYGFKATGSIIGFDGFLKVWFAPTKHELLPDLSKGQTLDCKKLEPKQHFTEPPPRYSDATLVKALEEHDIGRPSTYAPTISTIIDRNYVERIEGRKLKPTDVAGIVTDLLIKHFPKIVDFEFTAKLEEKFDHIAQGKQEWVPMLREFYKPFKENLMNKYDEIQKKDIINETTDEVCDKCNKPMAVKFGRYGKFLGCSGFPECRNIISLKDDKKEFASKSDYKPIPCPVCEGQIVEKRTRRGKIFYGCNKYPDCEHAVWNPPTGEKCPECEALLVVKNKKVIACSNKECKYTKATGHANP